MGGVFIEALSSVLKDHSVLALILNPDNFGLSNLAILHICEDYSKSTFFFSVKGQIVYILSFVGHILSVAYDFLFLCCCCSQSFKNIKSILSSRAIQKQAGD